MIVTDLDGKEIAVTDLTLALIQADDYRHYRVSDPSPHQSDQASFEDSSSFQFAVPLRSQSSMNADSAVPQGFARPPSQPWNETNTQASTSQPFSIPLRRPNTDLSQGPESDNEDDWEYEYSQIETDVSEANILLRKRINSLSRPFTSHLI